MQSTIKVESGGYYLFESLSSGRSCYYESEEEISFFKMLFRRYMNNYVEVHKMYLSSEGYQILLRIRGNEVIINNYVKKRKKRGKTVKKEFLEEPWRIVSEEMRQMMSLYVKGVNRMRGRKGVLVQSRYKRYYFEDVKEWEEYVKAMEAGKEIEGQENERYRVSKRWIDVVRWGIIRGKEWVESAMDITFKNLVIPNLIESTKSG